ncbi:MAG: hypothetical protein JNL58_01560 [Planctomyces sp.]|nr:hypothetical protein [Planctomyces sp.]
MKRVDVLSPAARLEDATKQLLAAWNVTKEHWSDPVSRKVEDEYLIPLQAQIRCLLDATTKLAEVLRTAEHECQHPRERRFML